MTTMIAEDPAGTWQVPGGRDMEPTFFPTPADLRAWFEANASTARELLVGFHRKGSGRPSITWPEAVDEALCVGWIDGVRRSIDSSSYTIRFTPRGPRSTWSAVNIGRVKALTAEGRMKPAGLAAFERRADERSAIYSYEQRHTASLEPDERSAIEANEAARTFWDSQPAGYRKNATFWIVSAKRPETRARRLAQLIEECAAGRRVGALTPPAKRQ